MRKKIDVINDIRYYDGLLTHDATGSAENNHPAYCECKTCVKLVELSKELLEILEVERAERERAKNEEIMRKIKHKEKRSQVDYLLRRRYDIQDIIRRFSRYGITQSVVYRNLPDWYKKEKKRNQEMLREMWESGATPSEVECVLPYTMSMASRKFKEWDEEC